MARRWLEKGDVIIASEMQFVFDGGQLKPVTPPADASFYMESAEIGDIVAVNFDTETRKLWWDDGTPWTAKDMVDD